MKPSIHAVFKALYELLRAAQLAAFNLPVHTNQTILMRMGQPYRVRALAGQRMEHAHSRAQPLPIGLLHSSFIHDDGLSTSAYQAASPALCSDTHARSGQRLEVALWPSAAKE